MAETVYLNDGTTEYIFDEKDVFLGRLIREKLGDDAARCFRDFVEERLQDAKDWEAQAVDNEKIADGYLTSQSPCLHITVYPVQTALILLLPSACPSLQTLLQS